ncbi:hypothetical protein RJ639_044415 [Escallonia herrerae]|uniref:Uncharacterized protein n=1 Tax=Escallonia herrerae TaxID=1293975 RepID=A0AA89AZN9_9ASTE|nr:hypothetical protein RJ639_044415 [Escallonia herrerae]
MVEEMGANKVSSKLKKTLLILNCALLTLGHCGGPLIMRLYFLQGGSACSRPPPWKPADGRATVVGVVTGVDDYLYAYGVARLPISTVALIIATQLAFTAGFAFLLVRQRFTSYSINAIVLLTVGAAVLALHTSSDRPEGESKEYVLGFCLMLGVAALYGFVLPLVELTYSKAEQAISYPLVMEFQLAIPKEATAYGLGEMKEMKDSKKKSSEKATPQVEMPRTVTLDP